MKPAPALRRPSAVLLALALSAMPGAAQEFGFGSADEPSGAEASADTAAAAVPASAAFSGARVGGKIEAGGVTFLADYDDFSAASISNGSTARLSFEAKGASAETAFKLKVSERILQEDPAKLIDEAYVRVFFGSASVEGGLLKVSWGKADSQGPLDVLNPFDLSDLTVTDTLERKIAQPMFRAAAAFGSASKLEAVFLPRFEPNAVAWEGKWMPAQIGEYKSMLGIADLGAASSAISFPDTGTLNYAQGGARFTTTVGSVDLGAQYFCGLLPAMAVSPEAVGTYLTIKGMGGTPAPIPVSYDRYHQAGADAAAELFGLNWRAELAANFTGDPGGDDPEVYNPTAAWSLGFDRDLFSGVNLNLQGSGSVRLFDGGVSSNGQLDLEDGTDAARTTITAVLTQKLLKDTVEWRLSCRYGVEDADFFINPSVGYIVDDARIDLAAGLFGGGEEGQYGQFSDSVWARLTLSYAF